MSYDLVTRSWQSGSRLHFKWNSPVVWADCNICGKDAKGRVNIRKECTCGIHATLWLDELKEYSNSRSSVAFLVEGLGNYISKDGNVSQLWAHEFGFTATGAQVVAVVNIASFGEVAFGKMEYTDERSLGLAEQAALQASDFFKVPILKWNIAWEMMKQQWEKLGLQWKI